MFQVCLTDKSPEFTFIEKSKHKTLVYKKSFYYSLKGLYTRYENVLTQYLQKIRVKHLYIENNQS